MGAEARLEAGRSHCIRDPCTWRVTENTVPNPAVPGTQFSCFRRSLLFSGTQFTIYHMLSGTFSILISSLKTQQFAGAPLKSGPQHQTRAPQETQPGAECSLFLSEQDILPVPMPRPAPTSLHAQGSTLFLSKSPCVHHHHLLNRAYDP